MAERVLIPPVNRQVIDPNTGVIRPDWERFLRELAAAINKLNATVFP